MPDRSDAQNAILGPSGECVAGEVWAAATAARPELAGPQLGPPPDTGVLEFDLFARLLFSCLVDADRTATGEYKRRALG